MAFLEYLGINPKPVTGIFIRILWDNYGVQDGEILYKNIRIHVGESLNRDGDKWQKEFEKRVLLNQIPSNTIMTWLGFQGDFIADFNRLKLSSSQTPAMMDYYLAEEVSIKAFCDLDLIDYIFATLLRQVANLKSLNLAMELYLNENPSKWTGMQVEDKGGLKLFYYLISNSYQTYGYDIGAIHLNNILLLRKLTLAYKLVLMR